jgi:hypothetical protein
MMANAILVLVFYWIFEHPLIKNNTTRAVVAILTSALLKTGWLWLSVRLTLPVVFGKPIPNAVAAVMTFPQLLTALAGGAMAWFALKILKN